MKNQELPLFGEYVTAVLIFRSSRPQMFFKIGVLKNFELLQPLFNKNVGLLLQNTYCGWFWIFKYFFSAESGIYYWQSKWFLLQTILKIRVKPQKQPLALFCQKVVLRNLAKVHRKTPVLRSRFTRVSFNENFIKDRLQQRCFP